MKATVFACFVGVWSLAAPLVSGADLDPSDISIAQLSHVGSGCPQGTLTARLAEDKSSLTLEFDQLGVAVGPELPITAGRKECNVYLRLQVPPGWSYAMVSVAHRGSAVLPEGLRGFLKNIFYVAGDSSQAVSTQQIRGPVDADYDVSGPISAPIWSSCRAPAGIYGKSQIRIIPAVSDRAGKLGPASNGTKMIQVFALQWKPCS